MENDLDMALCEMTKQRDDLLEALHVIADEDSNHPFFDTGMRLSRMYEEIAREAIAKAEGLHK